MYIINFYGPNNPENIPQIWPCEIKPFNSNGQSSDYVNSHKEEFGINESQTCMTQSEYDNYISTNYHIYEEWRNGVLNPAVKEKTIADIKLEAQKRIVAPLGYSVDQVEKWTSKEINMTAQGALLTLKIIQGAATSEDLATLSNLVSFFSGVNVVRNYSNYLENQVNSGINVDPINADWPSLV